MVDYLIHFIVSIPNKWTLMISIALSLLLKRGALGVVQLIILYMLRSQIYTPMTHKRWRIT